MIPQNASHSITTPRGRRHNLGYPISPAGRAILARAMPTRGNRIGLGDVNSDNANLTMMSAAQALQSSPPTACVQDGNTQNFQVAWNASTPGASQALTVDGKYGPQTQAALATALAYFFTDSNGTVQGPTNGTIPAQVCGGGGVAPSPSPSPSPSPTPVNPNQTTTVTTSSMNPWIIGGALVAAAGIAGWAYYAKGGGKKHLKAVHHRMTRR